jgi:hydrogenase maturation protease
LYEGYILYPYRPSIKNRRRWTFGGLLPEAYTEARRDGDVSNNQVECLIHGTGASVFDARVRFLQLTDRQVGLFDPPLGAWPEDAAVPPFQPVESLRVGDAIFQTWQEAQKREAHLGESTLDELSERPRETSFTFEGGRRSEPIVDPDRGVVGVIVREQQPVAGVVEASAVALKEGLFRLTVRVGCRSLLEGAAEASRDDALFRALVATHSVLTVREGAFVSLLDPPEPWREEVAGCRNRGAWPIMVGEEGSTDTMLGSPIILYDYPRIAPESPGDFFDGTEIDEILSLRILTLTDDEKACMAAIDDRAGALLARTESMAREQLMGLHGTIRGTGDRDSPGEVDHG